MAYIQKNIGAILKRVTKKRIIGEKKIHSAVQVFFTDQVETFIVNFEGQELTFGYMHIDGTVLPENTVSTRKFLEFLKKNGNPVDSTFTKKGSKQMSNSLFDMNETVQSEIKSKLDG